jgi:adenylate cyclase
MTRPGVTRKLAAILCADMAGYSRLMGEDETGTQKILGQYLDAMAAAIEAHQGRVVNYAGDAVLAEFQSVVAAVTCAVEIQQDLGVRGAGIPVQRRVQFRIGVNLGEVIVSRDDIYGDGVNVAARLEGLAEPGGICVSAAVHDQVAGKLEVAFADMGEQTVKNIAKPVHAYRVVPANAAGDDPPAAALLERPAVAVLPFTNLSGDPEQEYLSDGLTEDIITALAAWRSFPVIARNSTFAYKGQSPDVREVAGKLGARYVLEGSVRRAANRLRITAQLIDATTGHHIWADKFDRDVSDLFELQDEITQRIAALVEPKLQQAERKISAMTKPKSLDAWDCYQRGMAFHYLYTKEDNVRARGMFERACGLDPTYSQAFTGLAHTYQIDILLEFTDRREESIAKLFEAARQAVALDDADSMAHVMLCFACRWARQHDLAITEAEIAVELNPSNAFARIHLGNVQDFAGEPEKGIANINLGLQLNPQDPRIHFIFSVLARAYLNARQYEQAVTWARKAIHRGPDHARAHTILAIGLAHLGQQMEARAALDECERIGPGFAERWVALRQYRRPADNEHLFDGLRMAGLKESAE